MANSKPSLDPANTGTLQGMLQTVLEKFTQNLDNMIPAKVVSFDRGTNRAQIQPLIRLVKTDGDTLSRAILDDIPVFQASGGGFVVNFPLNAGDIGWLHASDRDISLFLQSYNESPPNTFRKHTFEDGMFYPDVMRGWTIAGENAAALVIQSLDGSQTIAVHGDKIKITADLVEIDTPDINCTGNISAQGNISAVGNMDSQGDIEAQGEIRTDLNGGIELSTHRHNGVDPGSGNSGGPIS